MGVGELLIFKELPSTSSYPVSAPPFPHLLARLACRTGVVTMWVRGSGHSQVGACILLPPVPSPGLVELPHRLGAQVQEGQAAGHTSCLHCPVAM